MNEDQVGDRWRSYFCKVLNRPAPDQPLAEEGEELAEGEEEEEHEWVDTTTRQEVAAAITMLKNNSAEGVAGIAAELIKYGGNVVKEKIYQ